MSETYYYLDQFTDEVMPCAPTLEGWAEWLARPDPEWADFQGAEDGETFPASVAEVSEIECVRESGRWAYDEAAADAHQRAGATFYLRHGSGSGWWPDNSGDTADEALTYADDAETGERAYLAAMSWRGKVEVRFDRTPQGPRCVIVGPIGHA